MYTTGTYLTFEPEKGGNTLTKSEINALLYSCVSPDTEGYDNLMHVPLLPAVLGLNEDRKITYTEMDDTSPFLIGGLSGSGKSTVLYSMIDSMLCSDPDADVFLIDLKALQDHKYADDSRVKMINDAELALKYLDELSTSVIKDRLSALRKMNVSSFGKAYYNKKDVHPVLLAIDEHSELIMKDRQRFEDAIMRIAQRGKMCGIYLICTTQATTKEFISPVLQTCFPSRICLRVLDGESSKIMMGFEGAEGLAENRAMICRESGTAEPFALMTTLTEDLLIEDRERAMNRGALSQDELNLLLEGIAVSSAGDSDDPNAMLTPEQIAALAMAAMDRDSDGE